MASANLNRGLLLATLFLLVLPVLFSCNKKKINPEAAIQLEFVHAVDDEAMQMDTILYENKARNSYSVTRLEYYLSNFTFIGNNGGEEVIEAIHYVNPRIPESLELEFELPEGDYQTLQFYVGLPADKNVSYSLPATSENVNMAWPENMGGGYHFMKFEGHFMDDQNEENGFAMHLGMNQWLVTVTLHQTMQFEGDDNPLQLSMNLNEWFENPHMYDFNIQGNYTMGVDSLMGQLSENGFSSFSLTTSN